MATARSGPRTVQARPAASVIVVAERDGLEVLLLRRRDASAFVGGMIVFPGGAVDDSDASVESSRLVTGGADAVVEGTGAGVAHMVAAVRETLEETGLWLGTSPDRPVAARRSIDEGRAILSDVAEPGSLAAELMPHAGRWVTPTGAPRRYDTHFFVTRADRQTADLDALEPDGREVVDLEWSTPAEALRRIESGSLSALEPTVVYLECLTRYPSCDAVIDAARRGRRVDHLYAWTTI